MTYNDFRDSIAGELRRNPRGLTWVELKDRLGLPYVSPCYDWIRRMERDVGLTRTPGTGRAYVWKVRGAARRPR